MVPGFDFCVSAAHSCIPQRATLTWHLFHKVFGAIHLLNSTDAKYAPRLKLVAGSYQSGRLLKAICIICRWKSNEKGILTAVALLSGRAVHNSVWYPDIISCNVILQFKWFSPPFLLKKTHVNKCQASMTDAEIRYCTDASAAWVGRDDLGAGVCGLLGWLRREAGSSRSAPHLSACILLPQPPCQFWVYFKEHYWEQNRRPSILMIWTRKIAFSVQINYPNHRVFCIHFNEITIYFIESRAFLLQIRRIYMINTWNLKGWLN